MTRCRPAEENYSIFRWYRAACGVRRRILLDSQALGGWGRLNNLFEYAGGGPTADGRHRSDVANRPRRSILTCAPVTGVVDKLAFTYHAPTPQISVATWNGIDHPVSYDAAGNELTYFATRTYSPRNLLATVTDNSGEGPAHTISYGYDARGVRVTRSESPTATGTATRYYTYSPELQLLNVTDDDSSNLWASGHASIMSAPVPVSHEFAYFNGIPVGELGPPRTPDSTVPLSQPRHRTSAVATTLYYTFADHLGTPLLQTDATGAVVWRAEHEPYGNVWKMRTGSRTDQPLRLPGQDLAMTWEGAEENYNIFRWYRAGWGRYTTTDPMDEIGEANPYFYVYQNPVTWNDPLGLFTIINAPSAERITIEAAFALIRSQMTKNTCGDCKKYFASQPSLNDIDHWTQPGGPPYVSTIPRPAGVSPDIFAYSQHAAPFTYTWLFKNDFFPSASRLSPCGLASLIVHEVGHLARQDTTDNEPNDFFKKCAFGCINPGKFK